MLCSSPTSLYMSLIEYLSQILRFGYLLPMGAAKAQTNLYKSKIKSSRYPLDNFECICKVGFQYKELMNWSIYSIYFFTC